MRRRGKPTRVACGRCGKHTVAIDGAAHADGRLVFRCTSCNHVHTNGRTAPDGVVTREMAAKGGG